MVAILSSCDAIGIHKMLVSLFDSQLDPTVIYCDNKIFMKVTENPLFHDRSKHIEIRYHFICDHVQKGAVKLQYLPTDEQVADILTKSLGKSKFVYFRNKMGVVLNTFLLVKREC